MSRFDLSNPVDFAKVTMSTVQGGISAAGGALLAITGGKPGEWDIEEAAYGHDKDGLVLFHVFKSNTDYEAAVGQIGDEYGRRKIYFEFPYKDGQGSDDMGRKGSFYDFNVVIFGQKYKKALANLIRELNDPRPGVLIHPVFGSLDVVVDDWKITHQYSERSAATIAIRFAEHSFEFKLALESKDVKSWVADALKVFGKIDSILVKVNANILLLQTVKNVIANGILEYKNLYAETLTKLNKTFNTSGSDDFPSLLPTNQGGSETVYPTVQSPSDPFASVPVDTIEDSDFAALAAQQATDQVILLRNSLNTQIDNLSSCLDGQGSLEFSDDIRTLKDSGISIQQVLETGLKSSNAKVVDYETPRLMSVREIAFANGLAPDKAIEIELLNPSLESLNYIVKGTIVQVPISG